MFLSYRALFDTLGALSVTRSTVASLVCQNTVITPVGTVLWPLVVFSEFFMQIELCDVVGLRGTVCPHSKSTSIERCERSERFCFVFAAFLEVFFGSLFLSLFLGVLNEIIIAVVVVILYRIIVERLFVVVVNIEIEIHIKIFRIDGLKQSVLFVSIESKVIRRGVLK